MKKSREVIGLPVIELREGKSLGRVQGLIVNTAERRVEVLEVGEKSLLKANTSHIPFDKIRSIGSDAVTLLEYDTEHENEQAPDKMLAKKLIGNSVVTVEGTLAGTLDDYSFTRGNGELADLFLTLDKTRTVLKLPVTAVENFGRDFIIVREDYMAQASESTAPHDHAGKQFVNTLEAKAVLFVLGREVGQDVLDEHSEVIIRKGEKVTEQVIELARGKNRLAHVLIAAGVGELLEGLDFTKEKVDMGSRKLLESWQSLRGRSHDWLVRRMEDDRTVPTGELRELWNQLQGKFAQGGRELEASTRSRIKEYAQGKTLAHAVYDHQGRLLAAKGDRVNDEIISQADAEGRLMYLFLSVAADEVNVALDPVKRQLKDLLQSWDKRES